MEKQIKGYSYYLVNTSGEVFSYKGGSRHQLKPYIDKDGYLIFRLSSDTNERKAYKAHRLVADTFIPNLENKPVVNHKDGVKNNNEVDNLEWVTHSENTKHAFDNNLITLSPYGIAVYDSIKGCNVAYFNGYDKLSAMVGLSKTMLYDITCRSKMLYGAFKLVVTRDRDYSNKTLFENQFIKRTIHGRFKPYEWNSKVFETTRDFQIYTGLSTRKFRSMLSDGKFQGIPFRELTHYEYTTV